MSRYAALLMAGAVCVSGVVVQKDTHAQKNAQQERDGWTASEALLVSEAKFIDDLYRRQGVDNNYLDYRVYDASEFAAAFSGKPSTVVTSRSKQTDALRHCVYQTKGAYGEHFSNQKAWQLAGLTTTRLRNARYITKIERIEGKDLMSWEIISAPCGVAVHDNAGKVLVMQGFGVD